MDLHDSAVQRHRLQLDPDEPLLLEVFEHSVEDPVLRPAIHPGVDGVQTPELRRDSRHLQPCSAMYRRALSTGRFETRTSPRCTGSNGATRSD